MGRFIKPEMGKPFMGDSDGGLLSVGLILIAGGVLLFVNGFRSVHQKRLIENIPTSKIRGIAMGLVEVKGKAIPAQGKLLKSPFSNSDCVYYEYSIESLKPGSKNGFGELKSGERREPFYLQDETGTVLVDPKGAEMDIPEGYRFSTILELQNQTHTLDIPGEMKKV